MKKFLTLLIIMSSLLLVSFTIHRQYMPNPKMALIIFHTILKHYCKILTQYTGIIYLKIKTEIWFIL